MNPKHKRSLIAAGIFAGAFGMLVPLTLFAEAGTAERTSLSVAAKKTAPPKKARAVKARPVRSTVVKKEAEPKAKAIVKVKPRSVAHKFLPVKHMGDY